MCSIEANSKASNTIASTTSGLPLPTGTSKKAKNPSGMELLAEYGSLDDDNATRTEENDDLTKTESTPSRGPTK